MFMDGKDFDIHAVLEWKIPAKKDVLPIENLQRYLDENDIPTPPEASDDDNDQPFERIQFLRRETFERALKSEWGATVGHEVTQCYKTVFVKVSFPFMSLLQAAEAMDLERPNIPKLREVAIVLAPRRHKAISKHAKKWEERFRNFKFLRVDDLPVSANHANPDPDNPCEVLWTPFRLAHKNKFQNSSDPDAFFTPSEKLMCVKYILDSVQNGVLAGHTLERLRHEMVYTAAFPLHAGPATYEKEEEGNEERIKARQSIDTMTMQQGAVMALENHRYILERTWSSWDCFFRFQPLNRIQYYFGEDISFYFRWLDFYMLMLIPCALIGLVVFMYGLVFFQIESTSGDIAEFCSSDLVMCPVCSTCDTWILKSSCATRKAGFLFDNSATLFFAVFMSIWATSFLDIWKQQHKVINYECAEAFKNVSVPNRPAYIVPKNIDGADSAAMQRAKKEIKKKCRQRRMVSILVLMVFSTAAILSVLGIIVFNIAVGNIWQEQAVVPRENIAFLIMTVSACLNVLFAQILSMVYFRLARIFTEWLVGNRPSIIISHYCDVTHPCIMQGESSNRNTIRGGPRF